MQAQDAAASHYKCLHKGCPARCSIRAGQSHSISTSQVRWEFAMRRLCAMGSTSRYAEPLRGCSGRSPSWVTVTRNSRGRFHMFLACPGMHACVDVHRWHMISLILCQRCDDASDETWDCMVAASKGEVVHMAMRHGGANANQVTVRLQNVLCTHGRMTIRPHRLSNMARDQKFGEPLGNVTHPYEHVRFCLAAAPRQRGQAIVARQDDEPSPSPEQHGQE
jgi:hypothetical protein